MLEEKKKKKPPSTLLHLPVRGVWHLPVEKASSSSLPKPDCEPDHRTGKIRHRRFIALPRSDWGWLQLTCWLAAGMSNKMSVGLVECGLVDFVGMCWDPAWWRSQYHECVAGCVTLVCDAVCLVTLQLITWRPSATQMCVCRCCVVSTCVWLLLITCFMLWYNEEQCWCLYNICPCGLRCPPVAVWSVLSCVGCVFYFGAYKLVNWFSPFSLYDKSVLPDWADFHLTWSPVPFCLFTDSSVTFACC